MILYLSSATDASLFTHYFSKGYVKSSLQAQRFNNLVAEGIGHTAKIHAIGHPQYAKGIEIVNDSHIEHGNVVFDTIGNNPGRLHRCKDVLSVWKYCRKSIKHEKPDFILCDAFDVLYSLFSFILSKLYSIKTIAIVTDLPQFLGNGGKSIISRVVIWLMRKYDGYVFLTEAMNGLVNKKHKPYIIMEGLCEEKTIVPRHLMNKDVIVCSYMGSLARDTGIELLVEAFQKIDEKRSKLVIYGGGEIEDYVKEKARQYCNIEYGGLVSNEKATLLQLESDLLINPRPVSIGYAAYSFPSKIMEYMSSGTPVLTTRLSGMPEEYFQYVYTIEDDSVEGIHNALLQVLSLSNEERMEKGRAAQQFVVQNKNNTVQGQRILKLYNQL